MGHPNRPAPPPSGRGGGRHHGPLGSVNDPIANRDYGSIPRLLSYARPFRFHLAFALFASLGGAAFSLVLPGQIGQIVDVVFKGDPSLAGTALASTALVLVGAALLQGIFNAVSGYLLDQTGEGTVASLRKQIFEHLMALPIRFFDNHKTGDVTSRLTSDVAAIQTTISNNLTQFVTQVITIVGAVAIMLYTSPKLAGVLVLIVPVIILAATSFGGRMRKISSAYQDRLAEANAGATEALSSMRVVQSFTAEKIETMRYADRVGAAYSFALQRAGIRALFGPTVLFTSLSGIAFVLWFGGTMVLSGEITAGTLVSFLIYSFAAAASIGQLAHLFAALQQAVGASSRLFAILDERTDDLPEPANPRHLPAPVGQIAIENVAFRYPHTATDVLSDISLTAEPGQVIALVGQSGAGKSTLVSLVTRFYDPSQGRITIDGIDLKDLPVRELRGHIGMVPQETQLFDGSILENIRYGRPTATDDEVHAAARDANADEFIQSFADGYHSQIGERGVKLSGGQRQRIAIARAILKNPRVLILDEATSSLDSESEYLVQQALHRLMASRTTFVIAHRLSTVHDADKIVVLDHGRIAQQGTHTELMIQGGVYRSLYERQFRTEEVLAA